MCHGAVLDAPRHDKNLARVEDDRAVPQLDVERPLEHKKEVVRVIMLVPVERAFELGP